MPRAAPAQLPRPPADPFIDGRAAQEEAEFPELGPGEVDRRTLALDAGEWRLRCTIPTHAERGMTAALTVTG